MIRLKDLCERNKNTYVLVGDTTSRKSSKESLSTLTVNKRTSMPPINQHSPYVVITQN